MRTRANSLFYNISQARKLSGLIRGFATTPNPASTDIIKDKFEQAVKPIIEEFTAHPANNHPFFDYLENQSQTGFNAQQFNIYRTNYFNRTKQTIASVAHHIIAATYAGDMQSLSQIGINIFDELGKGNNDKVHIKLLLDSHNKHGEKIFGLSPEDFKTVAKSPLLLPEAKDYSKAKYQIYKKSYPYIAGNMLAHEIAADGMLKKFRNNIFDCYKGYYTPEEYDKVVEYFQVHSDEVEDGLSVEQKHAELAKESAINACENNINNIVEIREGGMIFLNSQSKLWYGMLREMEKSNDKGILVPSKFEFAKAKIQPGGSPINAYIDNTRFDKNNSSSIRS